jgi:ABC-type Fe3+ transport system permease subunit
MLWGGKGTTRMSNFSRPRLRWGSLAIAFCTPALTLAQSCALCYTQAAGSGSRMIAALRSGILILAIPPTLFCVGITWMAYKKRNQFNEDQAAEIVGKDERSEV